ncbi:MAG: flagellar biosynthetic protein FliQ [Desulfurobacteriaceae bacterium]
MGMTIKMTIETTPPMMRNSGANVFQLRLYFSACVFTTSLASVKSVKIKNSKINYSRARTVDIDIAADLIKRTLELAFLLTSPVLAAIFVIGIVISIFQAATQINEMTLTFVPKLLLALLIMYFLSNWFLISVSDFTKEIWTQIPEFVR